MQQKTARFKVHYMPVYEVQICRILAKLAIIGRFFPRNEMEGFAGFLLRAGKTQEKIGAL